ncbi:MAG: pilus assembly protein PilM [Zavarzinella sp.]
MSRFIILDIDQQHVHVVSGQAKGKMASANIAITATFSSTDDTTYQLGKQLREILKTHRIAAAPVIVVVGRDKVVVKDLKIPPAEAHDEPNLVKFQATRELNEAPDSVILDYTTQTRLDADGQRKVLVSVLRKDSLKYWKAICAAAGLELAGITLRPYALQAAASHAIATGEITAPENKFASHAVIARGESWGELIICRDGEVVFTRLLPALALQSENGLLGEIRRNVAVYNASARQQPVEAIYVAEASGSIASWGGRLASGLDIPVQVFNPLANVPNDIVPQEYGRFAGLVGGLALRAASSKLPINFVTPRKATVKKDPSQIKLKYLAFAIIGFVFLALVGGAIYASTLKSEVERLQKKVAGLDEDLKKLELDKKKLDILKDWSSSRVCWLDELYDMTARLPDPKQGYLDTITFATRAPEKNAKVRYTGTVDMKIYSTSEKGLTTLSSSLRGDVNARYRNVIIQSASRGVARGNRGVMQTLKMDVKAIPQDKFSAVINASVPEKPGATPPKTDTQGTRGRFSSRTPGGESRPAGSGTVPAGTTQPAEKKDDNANVAPSGEQR